MIFGHDSEKGVVGMIVGEKVSGCSECENPEPIMDHAAGELVCMGCARA